MGYFPNGCEGLDYEAQYCANCVHGVEGKACAVWGAHMVHNYDECNKKDSILHELIPVTKDGLSNEQCQMFIPCLPEREIVKETLEVYQDQHGRKARDEFELALKLKGIA